MNFIMELIIYFIVVILIALGLTMSVKGFSNSPIKNRAECIEKKTKSTGVAGLIMLSIGVCLMILHLFLIYKNKPTTPTLI